MNQRKSGKRSSHLTSLYHLEGLLYASLKLTESGQEAVRLMQEAIRRLPPEYRLVFILSYLEGFRHEEIADLAGVEIQDVASMLQQGRELIKEDYFGRAQESGTRSLTINRVLDTGADWVNSETETSHACGATDCCRRHHQLSRPNEE